MQTDILDSRITCTVCKANWKLSDFHLFYSYALYLASSQNACKQCTLRSEFRAACGNNSEDGSLRHRNCQPLHQAFCTKIHKMLLQGRFLGLFLQGLCSIITSSCEKGLTFTPGRGELFRYFIKSGISLLVKHIIILHTTKKD